MDNTNILFMFLGGLSTDKHTILHYQKFFNRLKKSYHNKSLYIVVHPKNIDTFKIKEKFYKNISVVDKEHWIETKWATRSISDATLLMMQYAFLKYGDIFKKYVLLSPNCAPLYNFDIIYNEFNEDNKSWIQSNSNAYMGKYTPIKYYKFNGGPFDINTITNQSQWMALDRKHLDLFFMNNNNKLIKTYTIVNNNEIISSNKLFQSFLDAYKFQNYLYDSDNYFFISVISQIIKSKTDLINNIRTDIPIKNNKWIKKKNNIKNELIYHKEHKYQYRLNRINPDNVREIYYIYNINNKNYILKNGRFILTNDEKNPIIKGKKKGININIITTPSTYVDWDNISLDPDNLLRNFNIFLEEKYSIKFPDIMYFLQLKTQDAVIIIEQLEKKIKLSEYPITNFSIINNAMNPRHHPFEYYTYNIQEIINAYNLFVMMNRLIKIKDELYIYAKNKWKKIINNNNPIKLKNGYYDTKNKNTICGTRINSKILNNSLNSGALFIRKIKRDSHINEYSNELFNLKDYVMNL
jgi:hypothetical protein